MGEWCEGVGWVSEWGARGPCTQEWVRPGAHQSTAAAALSAAMRTPTARPACSSPARTRPVAGAQRQAGSGAHISKGMSPPARKAPAPHAPGACAFDFLRIRIASDACACVRVTLLYATALLYTTRALPRSAHPPSSTPTPRLHTHCCPLHTDAVPALSGGVWSLTHAARCAPAPPPSPPPRTCLRASCPCQHTRPTSARNGGGGAEVQRTARSEHSGGPSPHLARAAPPYSKQTAVHWGVCACVGAAAAGRPPPMQARARAPARCDQPAAARTHSRGIGGHRCPTGARCARGAGWGR